MFAERKIIFLLNPAAGLPRFVAPASRRRICAALAGKQNAAGCRRELCVEHRFEQMARCILERQMLSRAVR